MGIGSVVVVAGSAALFTILPDLPLGPVLRVIALPLTVGILGYAMKEKIDCLDFLFCASVFFLISTCAALWNLFRLPGLVTTVNMVSDYRTAVFQIIQLYSLLYGFLYLIIGAWKIVKN